MIQFELPQKNEHIIKVVGVGGGGGNAVNHMFNMGIENVNFIVCNTDMKALRNSPVPNKIQLGPELTRGLGAGAKPEVGRDATSESLQDIKGAFGENTQMVFVTAGMGGGTGTGGAPIVAKLAKEMGALTVGIVTTPFSYEGKKRKQQAMDGIHALEENVDTLLVISNDKVREHFGNVPVSEAFAKADDILATATKCITDVIASEGHIVVDFADVCTVMKDGGVAILGSAKAGGEKRAQIAVEQALNSPLLNDNNITGAQWILLNVNSSKGQYEHTLDEMEVIQAFVQNQAGEECDLILGTGYDESLGDQINVTIIATGFKKNKLDETFSRPSALELNKVVHTLQEDMTEKSVSTEEEDRSEETEAVFSVEEQNEKTVFTLDDEPMAPAYEEDAFAWEENKRSEAVEEPAIPKVMALGIKYEEVKMELFEKEEEVENQPEVPSAISMSNLEQIKNVKNELDNAFEDLAEDLDWTPTLMERSTDRVEEDMPRTIQWNMEITNEIKAEEEKPEEELILSTDDTTDMNNPEEAKTEPEFVTIKGITLPRKKGNRMLTDYELEQEANFELQKRAFDQRAAALRSLSFNVSQSDDMQEDEIVPAYVRKNVELDDTPSSADEAYSTVRVSGTRNDMDSNIDTLNTFLSGNKPD